jgi:flagellar hook assembly protein FlgD
VRLEVSDLAPTPNTATQEWNFIVESDKFVMVNARNFPNPFTSTTTIAFTLAKQGRVTIEIFDMAGRFVRELASDELMEAGPVRLQWNGTTAEGDELARGVYFYQITVKSELKPETVVKKMALMRSE